jgi:glycosyltransferase involved in cell wall biosynthesis
LNPRIHLVPETPREGPVYACAEIRLLRPFQHKSHSWNWTVSSGRGVPAERIDLVVTQRAGPIGADLGEIQELIRATRRIGAKLVVDLDDNLLAEHPSRAVEHGLRTLRWRVRWLLREADAVIVSTPNLARAIAHLNNKVYVFPNALDEDLVVRDRPIGPVGADVGYFGTASHLEDLMSIVADLEEGFSLVPYRPLFEICGVTDDGRLADLLRKKADINLIPTNAIYEQFMRDSQIRAPWSLAIAPLASTQFNESKSDIKYLDYAMFGAAGLFSASAAYSSVDDGETGLIVQPGGWAAAVAELLDDKQRARRIASNACQDLMLNRTLAKTSNQLECIVESILDNG